MTQLSWFTNKLTLLGLLILLAIASITYFLPETPEKLTLIDQENKLSFMVCPQLSSIKEKQSSGALNSTFSLLNWNIYKQQNPQWSTKLQEWSKQADFITLQEAKHDQALTNFSKQQHFYHLQNIAFTYQKNDFGVNTFSRLQPLQQCGTRYSEPWIQIPKTGIASTYAIQDSQYSLLLINLHGVNFTLTSKPLKEQVAPYLQLIKKHQGPVVISGDFNTWSKARTKEIIEALISMGFEQALFSKDQRLAVFGYPLDHVFYRGLKVLKAQSMSTTASDHTPQLVTFGITPEA